MLGQLQRRRLESRERLQRRGNLSVEALSALIDRPQQQADLHVVRIRVDGHLVGALRLRFGNAFIAIRERQAKQARAHYDLGVDHLTSGRTELALRELLALYDATGSYTVPFALYGVGFVVTMVLLAVASLRVNGAAHREAALAVGMADGTADRTADAAGR